MGKFIRIFKVRAINKNGIYHELSISSKQIDHAVKKGRIQLKRIDNSNRIVSVVQIARVNLR